MNKQIPNSEKYDLYRLVHSLNAQELRGVRSYLRKGKRKSDVLIKLFGKVKKQSNYDEERLKLELKLNKDQLSICSKSG